MKYEVDKYNIDDWKIVYNIIVCNIDNGGYLIDKYFIFCFEIGVL